ncbi:MAG: hypothetical protein ACKOA8_16610 [Deltaproteobacteria bacterium]
MYHATLKAFETNIMRQGLIPDCRLRMFDWCDKQHVFLALDPDIAMDFINPSVIEPAPEHEQEILELMKQGGVLLEIDQTQLDQKLLFIDPWVLRQNVLGDPVIEGGETFAYRGRIPPSAITPSIHFDLM